MAWRSLPLLPTHVQLMRDSKGSEGRESLVLKETCEMKFFSFPSFSSNNNPTTTLSQPETARTSLAHG